MSNRYMNSQNDYFKSLIYVLLSFKSINGTNQVFLLLYLQMNPSDWYRVKYPHSLSLLPAAAP